MGLSVQLVAAQFLLYALGWGLCSLLLRERQRAVAHWATYLLLTGAGFVLTCLREEPRTWWPFVGANLCFLLAYAFLRRGTELFMGLVPRDPRNAVDPGPPVPDACWRPGRAPRPARTA